MMPAQPQSAGYRVRHETRYTYSLPVTVSHHAAHLRPRDVPAQTTGSSALKITPEPANARMRHDYFGNPAVFFTLETPHRELVVAAESEVMVQAPHLPADDETPPWETARDRMVGETAPDMLDALDFVFDSPLVRATDEILAYATPSFAPSRPLLAAVRDLTARIHGEFRYDPTATTVSTPLEQVLRDRAGVCQDFAHLQIACLRAMGLAARYVSGYVLTGNGVDSPQLVGADASHAWLAVFVPGHGWIDVDPTNNLFPGIEHITVAWGRDFDDVSPLKGVMLGGGEHTLDVEVSVRPLSRTPA